MYRTGLVTVIWLMFAACPARAGSPSVIVSIKPLHSLVAGVMAGVAAPVLLVDGAVSEHGYALRPSQVQTLAQADLVFWIGPQLETFLIRPLSELAVATDIIAMSGAPDIKILPLRDAGTMAHRHGAPGSQDQAQDMHIWLDPDNAAAMVRAISTRLQTRDPGNAAIYSKNAAAMQVRLTASRNLIRARLSSRPMPPYMVFHDAYQYFEARFDLRPVAIISLNPERPPGAARVRALRQLIRDARVACVFSEPQFEPRLIATLLEGSAARAASLDPLGADLTPGADMYFLLLDQIVTALNHCAAAD